MAAPDAQEARDWPVWATEPVDVVEYDPAWAEAGTAERQRLQQLLAPWLTGAVEHVGSTAVPGLAAKAILDLQAPVADLTVADAVASTLAPSGWHYVNPELDQRDYRRLYVRVVAQHRVAHLHLMTPSSTRWQEQIAFREALLAAPDLVHAYASLKAKLARDHRHDREAYTAAKQQFVQTVLDRANQAREP